MWKNNDWKNLKKEYASIYKKLNLKEARLSNVISHFTFILLCSVLGLLCGLISSIAIAQNEYVYVYASMFSIITLITILFLVIYERNNLYSIVNVIWRKMFEYNLDHKLNNKLMLLTFNLSFKRYWFTWLITLLGWLLILICVFVLQYYLHHNTFNV